MMMKFLSGFLGKEDIMNIIVVVSIIILLFAIFNYDKISYKVMSKGKNNFKKYYWGGKENAEARENIC